MAIMYSFTSKPPERVPTLKEIINFICLFEFSKLFFWELLTSIPVIRRLSDSVHWFLKLLVESIIAKYYISKFLAFDWNCIDAFIYCGTPQGFAHYLSANQSSSTNAEKDIILKKDQKGHIVVLSYLVLLTFFLGLVLVRKNYIFNGSAIYC